MDAPFRPTASRARLIEGGAKLLRQMVRQLLANPNLKRALRFDPHMRLNGHTHARLRAQVRLVKQFAKAWIWVQARTQTCQSEEQNPHPRPNPDRDSAPSYGVDATARPASAPQGDATDPLKLTDKSAKARLNKGDTAFTARFRLGSQARQKCNAKNTPKLDPSPLPQTVTVHLLPEAQAWLFGHILTPSPPQISPPSHNEAGRTYPPSNAPKAGQIAADLLYLAELVDAPEALISKARHTLKLTQTPPDQPDEENTPRITQAQPSVGRVKPPRAPTLEKLELPADLREYWQAMIMPPPKATTHPPPG